MAFTLPPPPYADNALEPHLTAEPISFTHGKHPQTDVTNLNNSATNHQKPPPEPTQKT